jgi:UDP-N-acetylmuramoyl-L-alanyl-D-glutamate--2,6-diaminopimelate ligase
MKLRELLSKLPTTQYLHTHAALDADITGLKTNSHACGAGDLFIGMPGTRVDGGEFWPGAIENGATAAVISITAAKIQPIKDSVFVATAENMIQAGADLAAAFYNYPARTLKMVGVTGTNGKTTTTHIIEFLLADHQSTALLGTLYTRWQGYQKVATHTTPFAVDLQQQLSEAVKAGCQVALMEVSSHALDQGRAKSCPFEIGVFTNLTQDHLDYHQDMETYFQAKALLFTPEYLKGRGIINFDDAYGKKLIASLPKERVWSYSAKNPEADLWTDNLTYSPAGVSGNLHTPLGDRPFTSPLVGDYNLANVLAAVGCALHLGMDLDSIVAAVANFPGVPGRMEQVKVSDTQQISVIVDYAHTPDSLDNLLKAARPFISGQMICVFGCGGDRDRTKRPLMGKIASDLADQVIVTSDNPRTENPETILADVVAGIPGDRPIQVIADRAEAISKAIREAQPGDGVLIAGKGHEDYQIIGTEKIHFDDREQSRAALTARP